MENKKATKIEEKLKLLENWLTKEDFLEGFENLFNYVKKVEKKLELLFQQGFQTLSERVDKKLATIQNGRDGKDGKDGYTPVKDVDYFDGEDGKDADEAKVTQEVIKALTPLIPPEQTGEDYRNGLEALVGPERLSWKAIDGLEELKENIEKRFSNFRVQTPRYVHVPKKDKFTGDGSTKSFTLSKAPKDLDLVTVHGQDFPYTLMHNDGFTITGKTLTIASDFDAPTNKFIVHYYV